MRSPGAIENGSAPAVPAGDHQLALVIRVDQADEIAEHDAVLVAETGARKDHCGETRVFEVDRDARGERACSRRARAAAAPRRKREDRRPRSHAWRAPEAVSRAARCRRDRTPSARRPRSRRSGRDACDQLVARVLLDVVRLGREPDRERRRSSAATDARMSGARQVQLQRLGALLDLALGAARRGVVRDRGRADVDVRVADRACTASCICSALSTSDARHARRRGEAHRPADERDAAPASRAACAIA
jgi:hypothetical protein